MGERFQWARADGSPAWSTGQQNFDDVWENARDQLRFHRGEGFTIAEKGEPPGRKRTLAEVPDYLEPRVAKAPLDQVFLVRSLKDGFAAGFRRHEVATPKGEIVIQKALSLLGTPYLLGATDCSWYSMTCVRAASGLELIHKATLQMLDSRVTIIAPSNRDKVKQGDLLFHWGWLRSSGGDRSGDVDHVSMFMDNNGPGGTGRVVDEEPHDTGAPAGWPTANLGVGARIRPMISRYYCDWEHVVAIGRIESINGKP